MFFSRRNGKVSDHTVFDIGFQEGMSHIDGYTDMWLRLNQCLPMDPHGKDDDVFQLMFSPR